jgi:L-aminopeptidase/D-esterase-like protein
MNSVQEAHAVVLSGGSAFGLEASCGVMDYLREKNIGYQAGKHRVPIVAGAVLFDLDYKQFAFPDKALGYQACQAAVINNTQQGNVGAGTGATVGKILGPDFASKGGLGIATIHLNDEVELTAVVAVNAFGDIYNEKNERIAGIRHPENKSAKELLLAGIHDDLSGQNTTIGCILTNAKLSKEQANKLADIAHDGLALAISPVHTEADGDTIFALASGEKNCNFLALSTACVEAVRKAIIHSVSIPEQ